MRVPTSEQAALFAIDTGEETAREAMNSIGVAIDPEGRASFHRIVVLGAALVALPEHARRCEAKLGDAARALARLLLTDDPSTDGKRHTWSLVEGLDGEVTP